MRNLRVENGFTMFLSAIRDILVAAGRSILSALAYVVAGAILGAVVGAATALYSGFGLVPGLLIGAAIGAIVVFAIQALVISGGNW